MQQGEKFNVRAFHDFVWKNGNVPIDLLRWEYLGEMGSHAVQPTSIKARGEINMRRLHSVPIQQIVTKTSQSVFDEL
jgi:hypothetical protein